MIHDILQLCLCASLINPNTLSAAAIESSVDLLTHLGPGLTSSPTIFSCSFRWRKFRSAPMKIRWRR